jgi:ABC-2 type transport system permease protein|tara:strand:- start:3198 stop:3941 length:744 start_codon:yes stop_codon:yes gene_type:complete
MNTKALKSSVANIKPIFKREFISYFNSPIAYIFVAVFLIIINFLFFQRFFLNAQANMREWFGLIPWLFLLLAPALTMRSWAEEKKTGTIEFLLTLPIRDWEIVIAKFLSAFSFMILVLVFSLVLPITIGRIGDLDIGVVIAGYIGAILMGGMYLSLGLLLSSLTKNQIVSFLLSLTVLFLIFFIGSNNVISFISGPLATVIQFVSTATHFNSISKGILDSRDLIYYISFTALFLYLNVQAIGSRNWR